LLIRLAGKHSIIETKLRSSVLFNNHFFMNFKKLLLFSLALAVVAGGIFWLGAPAVEAQQLPLPVNVQASYGTVAERVTITWTAPAGAPAGMVYQIGRGPWDSVAPTYPENQGNWQTAGTLWWDTSATLGVSYRYYVRSCLLTPNLSCSTWEPTGGVIGYRPVGKAANITATDGLTSGITVSWTKPAGGVYSAVYRCASAVYNTSCVRLTPSDLFTDTSYLDTGGDYNYNYYYAIDSAGDNGRYSGPQISTDTGYWLQAPTTPSFALASVSSGCQGVTPYVSASWTGRSTNTWLKISSSNSMAPYWDHVVASGSSYTSTGGTVAYSAGQAGITSPLVLTAGNTYYVQVTDGVSAASNVLPVTATNCAVATRTLTISKAGSTGGGTVTGTNINCGSTCSASYNVNSQVTLNASAAPGSTFAGWGSPCSGTGSCTVTMDDNKTVIATFNAPSGSTGAFTLSNEGHKTVTKGDAPVTITNVITAHVAAHVPAPGINVYYGGFSGTGGGLAGVPSGVTATISPDPCQLYTSVGTCNSTVTLTVSPSVAAGTYAITVYGAIAGETAPPVSQSTGFNLVISNPAAPPGGGEAPAGTCPTISVGGWVPPPGAAPYDNASTPLNAAYNVQFKRGCLYLGNNSTALPIYPLQVAGSALLTGSLVAREARAGTVTATTVTGNSDARLKTKIAPLADSVRDLVMKLNPVSFVWRSNGQPDLGFVAAEVAPLFPELVSQDGAGYQTLNYDALLAPLLKTVQENHVDLDSLRAQIEALEANQEN
jgi:hypothetical protein